MTDLFLREYKAACAMVDAEDHQLPAAIAEFFRVCEEESRRRKCRLCGCTDEAPCEMVTGGVTAAGDLDDEQVITCAWVENDLCSFCASTMFRDREIKTSRGEAIAGVLPQMLAASGGWGGGGG